ncbi:hypothetical protein MTO96_030396 [Rhipicephalus appendiculatus]
MSPLQLFFVSGCYLHCDPDISKVSCSHMLRWNAAFREAFHCRPGQSHAGQPDLHHVRFRRKQQPEVMSVKTVLRAITGGA